MQLMASDTKLHFGRRIRGEDKGHNTKGRHREPISFGIISGSYKSGMHVPSCGRAGVGLGLAFVSLWDAFVINCFSFGSMWDQLVLILRNAATLSASILDKAVGCQGPMWSRRPVCFPTE